MFLFCSPIKSYNLSMDEYVKRLVSCGVSHAEAVRTVNDFLKNYHGTDELREYIEGLENDRTYEHI